MHSLTHGVVAGSAFFAAAMIAHGLGIPSAIGGGVAVLVLVGLSFAAGIPATATFRWFLVGLVLAVLVWWLIGAIVNGMPAAIMYDTVFGVLAMGYGLAAFVLGWGARLIVDRLLRRMKSH